MVNKMLNIIANGKSGKGRGRKNVKKIVEYCMKNGIDYALYFTARRGHATEIARAISSNGENTIVALGGDGTFHEVLNGIADFEKTTLGFIPSGRGNDFARTMGLKLKPIEALKDILRGKTRKIDYIEVGDNLRCLNICGTGLDVDVLRNVEGKTNKISYIVSLLKMVVNFKPYKVTVTADNGESITYEDCIVADICNGKAFGGNIKISPDSKIDDGKLDLIVVTMPADGKLLPVVPKFIAGAHMNLDITHHSAVERVVVECDHAIELDGEIYEDGKLDCKIVKGGLTTFAIL